MRAALISLAGPQPAIAGRSLARRQLDFALAAGCTRIFAVGDGASPEALSLNHAAERVGARLVAIRDGRGLLGALSTSDELLVLAPGLLPEAEEALADLATSGILVVPAVQGVAAGLERIDLERAWAGALVVPGGLVERLAELPPDSEPAAALLRIALQAGVPQRRLPESVLADDSWIVMRDGSRAAALGSRWLARHQSPAAPYAVTERAAQALLKPLALRLLAVSGAPAALAATAMALQAGAVALSGWVSAPLGLVVLALGLLCSAFADRLGALSAAPFAKPNAGTTRIALAGWLGDAALAACGALAISGAALHRLFPPLILVGLLRASRIAGRPSPAALFGDRALLALTFALAAVFGQAEPAIMLCGLAILLLNTVGSAPKGG